MHHPRRPIRPCSALLAVCGLLSGGQTALAAAAAGDRDAGFGNGGVAVADLADTAFGRNSSALYLVRVQADGRIVGLGTGAGGGFVARWNANGTVDPTFGIGGLSVLPGRFLLSTAVVKPIALTLLADGRILVGGSVSAGDPQVDSGSYAAVWRLGANGLPDLAWNGGRPFLDMSPSDTGGYTNAILGVHPQGDGSVLATAQLTGSMAVLKLTPGGQPDTAFAPAGRKTLTVPNTSSLQLFRSVAQPDGRILVTGAISRPPNGNDGDGAIVARLTTAGTFDTGFDGDGYTVFKFGTPPDAADQLSRWWGQDIALQSDGAILVSGSSYYGGSDKKQQSGVVRLTPAGAIDTAFGTLFSGVSHGFIFNGKNANPDMAEGIAVQGDDRIITGGWNFPSSYVARHTADGRTRQFEVAPPTTAQGGWPGYWIHAIALQGDGGVIAAGEGVTAGNDNRSLLLRITAAGARDTTFGGGAPGLAPQPAARAQEIVSELLLADGKPVVAAAVTLDDSSGNGLTLSGLARFTGEGALDPSFSGDGRLVLRLGSAATTNAITEVPADVARDAQGRLLVVGPALASNPNTGTTEPTLISLARFLADGTPDSGFATGGRIQFPAKGPYSVMAAVAVQADGKPVLITGSNGSTGTEILLRRLTAAGAADTTFNGSGSLALTTVISMPGTFQGDPVFARGAGIAITGDGKILVGGRPTASGSNPKELVVARYTATGALDTTFGVGGYASVELATGSLSTNGTRFRRMRQLADGRILLVTERFLVRLTATGALDTGFNGTGILAFDPTPGLDTLASVAESGATLVVVGTVGVDTPSPRIRVSRHLADGGLDTGFGVGGVVDRDFGIASDVEILSDGRIVVAASGDGDATVYRYLPAGTGGPIAILADRTAVGVSEGTIATVGVRLGSAPTGPVTVSAALAGGGDPDLRVTGGASLVFTPDTWNTYQTVTLSAQADPDVINGTASLVLSGTGLAGDTMAVSEIDDGLSPVQIQAAASLTVPEGGNAPLAVRLAAAPTANVVIAAALQSGGDPNLSLTGGATLTFTPATWSTPQNVTIAAAVDADTANGSASLRLSAAGLQDVFVSVIESDAGTPPVATIASLGDAREGGAVGGFIITLSKAAPGPVSVAYAIDGTSTASPGDYTLNRSSPVSIPTGQTTATVTLTATTDAVVEGTETVRIQLTAASGYTLPPTGALIAIDIEDAGGTATNAPPGITATPVADPQDLALP